MSNRLPGPSYTPGSGTPGSDGDVPVAGTQETRALHEEINRAREELGDTVEELAAKADVKARTRETVEQAKLNARDRLETAKMSTKDRLETSKAKAAEVGGQARYAVQKPENSAKIKGGAAGAAVLAVVVWAIRRRRNRPKSRWERTSQATRHAWDRAAIYGGAALHSDRVAGAMTQARQAATHASPRRKGGAAALLGTAAVLAYRRRRRSARSTTTGFSARVD